MPKLLLKDLPFDDDGYVGKYVTDFSEITEADLDPPPKPGEEGDDTKHADKIDTGTYRLSPTEELANPPAQPMKASKVRVVEHHRDIKFKSAGADVVALKRALTRVGFFPKLNRRTPFFGLLLSNKLKKYQAARGLSVDGVYGINTHKRLVEEGGFDRYGAFLMAHAPLAESVSARRRRLAVAYWMWGYHNRDRIYYLQRRPMRLQNVWELPTYEDCSEFVERGYKAGDGPDPNGFSFNGLGYTGTMANHGILVHSPQPGDANLYGRAWNGFEHTTGQVSTVEQGDLCCSMGSSSGPLLLNRRYRNDFAETRSYL